ncbi:ATP-dependent Zn protease [Sinorhizobium meliloti]|nr:ATP-dependent Zn protease [Sinorhizobium meliloti]MDW9721640.1 ATP-dependent Zn protease [Sinorhizobium meliloti]MDW9728219.1 ATP-dependent Zn protease [Sinorhizobium meliloti]MDW9746763.1 ATP-dependent Zn protease [Sinorhizobium meliloti]
MTATSKQGIEPATPDAAVQAILKRLATRAMGLTGADIERIVRQARLKARRQKRSIRYEDIEEGIRMDRRQLPYDLRWRFAIHESGHAVVHHVLRLGPIHGLNIDTPSGGGYSQLGFTASGSDTLGYREDMLIMLMAGRAAEQIVVGSVSAGSGGSADSDLARATKLALAMERSLGFGAIQPLLYRENKDPTAVLDSNPDLAARIHAKLEGALARAVEIINDNRDKLDTLTKALFDAQALDGEAVMLLLKHGDRVGGS